MPRIRQINLQTPVFNPVGFNPVVFEPKQGDMNLLANSLNILEQRRVDAEDQMAAMDTAFAKVRENLHNDPETMQWFQNYTNQYKQKVDELAQRGDYANALTAARRAAAEAINNPELQARINTNAQYQKALQEIKDRANSGNISQTTRDRWIAQNQYNFSPKINEETGEILSAEWNHTWNPVQKVDLSDLLEKAAKLTSTKLYQGTSTKFINSEGKLTDNYEDNKYGVAYQSTSQVQSKSPQRIQEVFDELMQQNPDAMRYLMQTYEDTAWEVAQLDKRLEGMDVNTPEYQAVLGDRDKLQSDILDEATGMPLSGAEYLKKRSSNTIKNMAINNIIGSTSYGNGLDNYKSDQQRQYELDNTPTYGYIAEDGYVNASTIEVQPKDNFSGAYTEVQNALGRLFDLLESLKNSNTNNTSNAYRYSINNPWNNVSTRTTNNNTPNK